MHFRYFTKVTPRKEIKGDPKYQTKTETDTVVQGCMGKVMGK
jgi:hypothetical protein